MTDAGSNSGRGYLIAAILTLAAALTRLYGLSEWDFLVDEFATVAYAEKRMTSIMNPAYYALAWLGFQSFGVNELTARLPAALFGIAVVPVFYLTWRNVFGRYAAAAGALFIILSSWHLWFSQFSRFYSAVFLFGSLSYYIFWRSIEKDDLRLMFLALLLSVVGVLFHFTAVFVPASCAAFALLLLVSRKFGICDFSPRVPAVYAGLCLVAGLSLLPFLLGMLDTWQGKPQDWGRGPVTLLLQIAKYVQLPLFIAAGAGALQMYRAGVIKQMFVLVGAGFPLLCLVILSTITTVRPDYLFYALPLVYLSAGYLCASVARSLEPHAWLAHVLTVVLAASQLPEFISHYTGHGSVDVRDAISYVESEYRSGDKIVPLVSGFDYYAEGRLPIEKRPGIPYDKSRDWAALMDAQLSGSGDLWIIMPAKRKLIAPKLRKWLGDNASLAWRKYEERFDYTFRGYEIYIVRGAY